MADSWNDWNRIAQGASTEAATEPIHLVETLHRRLRPATQEAAPATSSSASMRAVRSLYLNLLKKSLTNTLFNFEPDIDDDEFRFVRHFTEHYVNGAAVSMLPIARLDNLEDCIVDVIESCVPGDLIEAGVWRGGATIFMRAVLKAYNVSGRSVWVADSFEGLPRPDAERFPLEAKTQQGPVMQKAYKNLAVGLEEVQGNFRAYELFDGQVRFLKGWFKDTLPSAPIHALAILRLDGDFYQSIRDGLDNLYDRLSAGGYVIIDDYGEDSWTYCRKAVDDFRRERGIHEPLVRVDSKCFYWKRTQ
jgi:Macrocin-O-methyltransferase (TylF)